ncbi:MAG: YqiA/YcfP family alpha/beta fold hydrolase [Burkholderiales bacterium]
MRKYAGARQIVVEGGDHTLKSFPDHLPAILEFAGLAPL